MPTNRSKTLLTAVSIFVLLISPAIAAPQCSIGSLTNCQNTNDLVWATSFQNALEAFLSDQHGAYTLPGTSVANQALIALGGPPDSRKSVGSLFLFGACVEHDCMEKGAAVLTPDGKLIGVGLLCLCSTLPRESDCFREYHFTIFVREGGYRSAVLKTLADWAKQAILAQGEIGPWGYGLLAKVETIDVSQ
jgi:hypothetical protein